MRKYLFICFLLTGFLAEAQEAYRLQLNDKVVEISPEKEYEVIVSGKKIKLKLTEKDTLLHEDDLFSFQYPKDYKLGSLKIDEGIEQITLITAEGSGLLIQKYSTMNPTMLNEMMISEVTKESINYGFAMERKDYSRKLKSGHEVNVDKAVLVYRDEVNIYEVATLGTKDEGILILTMLMDEESPQGQRIIDLMWNSLSYKSGL